MKKFFLSTILVGTLAAGLGTAAAAQSAEVPDSLKAELLQEAVVSSVRASSAAPFASTDIDGGELSKFSKTTQEIPFLLARTPGVLAWSENGIGSGTSYMRIRGAADSRINITLDGVPLNSPEDQCVFWANMSGYTSMLGSIQIQRGVGTSTNGDGAFGGSVSLSSKSMNPNYFVEVTGGYGTYNTWKGGISFSTGLIAKGLVIDGAFNMNGTDGFIHGTRGNSGSGYLGLGWLGKNFQIRYRAIGNFERTGQAWNGIEIDGMKTYKEVWNAGLGRYNSLVESYTKGMDGSIIFQRYTWRPKGANEDQLWDRTTDNFRQLHNILSGVWEINPELKTTLSLHYTRGYGFYEELKPECKLKKFGFANFTDSQSNTIKKADFVRQKGLSQNAGGLVWNIIWNHNDLELNAGVSAQQFWGNHFGYLTYVRDHKLEEFAAYVMQGKDLYQYYNSDAQKTDASAYIKATYTFAKHFNAFADLQYRFVKYKTWGNNDKWDDNLNQHILDIDKNYNFVNPKVGLSYLNKGHKAYASVAYSNREPERNNFTDNGSYPAPSPESLIDFELGYNYQGKIWHAGANLYYMWYKNQFVQTGLYSDIGEALTTNIPDSYRMGIELTAGVAPLKWLSLEANAAISRNRLTNFDEHTSVYDADWNWIEDITVHYDNSPLAFSPTAIVNAFVDFHTHGFQATWHTAYVSKQFMDNTGSNDRALPGYTVSDLSASYRFDIGKALRSITIGFNLGNIFNSHYATAGYAYSYVLDKENPKGERLQGVGFIPQAGFTAMGNLTFRF